MQVSLEQLDSALECYVSFFAIGHDCNLLSGATLVNGSMIGTVRSTSQSFATPEDWRAAFPRAAGRLVVTRSFDGGFEGTCEDSHIQADRTHFTFTYAGAIRDNCAAFVCQIADSQTPLHIEIEIGFRAAAYRRAISEGGRRHAHERYGMRLAGDIDDQRFTPTSFAGNVTAEDWPQLIACGDTHRRYRALQPPAGEKKVTIRVESPARAKAIFACATAFSHFSPHGLWELECIDSTLVTDNTSDLGVFDAYLAFGHKLVARAAGSAAGAPVQHH